MGWKNRNMNAVPDFSHFLMRVKVMRFIEWVEVFKWEMELFEQGKICTCTVFSRFAYPYFFIQSKLFVWLLVYCYKWWACYTFRGYLSFCDWLHFSELNNVNAVPFSNCVAKIPIFSNRKTWTLNANYFLIRDIIS